MTPTEPTKQEVELEQILTALAHMAAHKAQVDYFAVNSPNGIRSGQSSDALAGFLDVDIDHALAAIESLIAARVAEAEARGRAQGKQLGLYHTQDYFVCGDLRAAYADLQVRFDEPGAKTTKGGEKSV